MVGKSLIVTGVKTVQFLNTSNLTLNLIRIHKEYSLDLITLKSTGHACFSS